jgi:hypothetical protein
MPTFCRHNRFIERCPICSKTVPEHAPAGARPARAKGSTAGRTSSRTRRAPRAEGVRVKREGRAADDGFQSELVPGIRSSEDAARLAQELAFSSGRLLALAADPPGLYREALEVAERDLAAAAWTCFLIVYLSPLEDDDPFAGIREALAGAEIPDLDGIALGPRTSHDPSRAGETLIAYRQWVQRAGDPTGAGEGAPATLPAFSGEPSWSPERRFERVLERLTLPGFGRSGRYDLLVTLGRLGVLDLRAGSLHLAGAGAAEDATLIAAKRVFGIGDPLLLERRSAALADAASVPIEALDLALWNWAAPQRATLGMGAGSEDEAALARALVALGL